MLVFWNKSLLQRLRVSFAPVYMQLSGTGGWGWCKQVLPLMGLKVLLSEVPPYCCWGRKWSHTTLSSPDRGSHFSVLQEALTEERGSVREVCPAPQLSCVLSLAWGWESKHKILKDLALHRPSPFFWLEPFHAVSGEKQSHTYAMYRLYDVTPWKSATRLLPLCMCFCPLLMKSLLLVS